MSFIKNLQETLNTMAQTDFSVQLDLPSFLFVSYTCIKPSLNDFRIRKHGG